MNVLVLLTSVVWGLRLIATSSAILSKVFLITAYENGTELCALDQPSRVQFESSLVDCGVSCVVEVPCLHFNYFSETLKCETFNFAPNYYDSVDGCQGHKILATLVSPLNTSYWIGSDVLLECRRSTQLIRWIFSKSGTMTDETIVEHCQVLEAFRDAYVVDKTSLSCNLMMRNATAGHSGTYGCHDELSTEPPATAELMVRGEPICPAGFQYISEVGSCYQVLFRSLPWVNASEICRQLYHDSYLAVITSASEQNAIANFLQAQMNMSIAGSGCLYPGNHSYGNFIWIGGQTLDLVSCSPFVWKKNVAETLRMNYTNWLPWQPDCQSTNEHCMHVWENMAYRWNDLSCAIKLCALCECAAWY